MAHPSSDAPASRSPLAFEGVYKSYGPDGSVPVLRGATFALEPGSFSVLMGPSGSGKSTLLHLACGLDRPDEGETWILGRPLSSLTPKALGALRRRQVGMVFQFFNLIPTLRVVENVEYTCLIRGDRARDARARALAALEEVELVELASRFPRDLSGGEQQRAAIARCLAISPELVLADEPTAHLDSQAALALFQLCRRIRDERGTTFFVATHDARIRTAADRHFDILDGVVRGSAAGGRG